MMEAEGLLDPGANYMLPFGEEQAKVFQTLQKPKNTKKKEANWWVYYLCSQKEEEKRETGEN